jgi:hypothetical protein
MPLDPGGPNDQHFDKGRLRPGLNVQARVGPGVLTDEPLDRKELRKRTAEVEAKEAELAAREEAIREKEESLASLGR